MGIKNRDKVLLVFILAIGTLSLIYGSKIKQRNPESIFLGKDALSLYTSFTSKVAEKQHLVFKRTIKNVNDPSEVEKFYKEIDRLKSICFDECEIITDQSLNKSIRSVPEVESNDLIKLKGTNYLAALFVDNSDVRLKDILQHANNNMYFKDRKLNNWAGIPFTNFLLDHYSLSIQETLFPAMFVLGFFITFFFVRNILESLILYLPCLFMAGISLSTLRILENDMNMVTSIIPLVIFTVTLSLSFHSFFSIKEFGSLKQFLKNKWKPVFLMMFTTYIGFLSLITSDVSVIVVFGNLSAQLVLIGTGLVYLWYSILDSKIKKDDVTKFSLKLDRLSKKSSRLALVYLIILISLFASIFIPKRLDVLTDATKYFPAQSGFRENILDVSKTVAGLPVLEIIVDLPNELDQTNIRLLESIEEKISLKLGRKDIKVLSNNSFIRNINSKYAGKDVLPESMISYFTLRGQLPLSLQESYPVDRVYRMTILGGPSDVLDYKKDLELIEQVLRETNYKYTLGGLNYTLMLSQETMINVLYKSFLSSALVVFACAFFYFRKLKIFIAFCIVSLVPVLSSFLFMYLFNFSINIATVMTFSIALGLIGDSSFHIIHARVHHPFKNFEEYSSAVLVPVIISGLLLFVCFGMFTINSFLPIRQFGGVLAYIIFTGTILDIYVLPRLLYSSINHKDEYNKLVQK